MSNSKDDGATVVPGEPQSTSECMGRFAHRPQWVWENGKMTDRVECSTCAMQRQQSETKWFQPAAPFQKPNAREAFLAGAQQHLDEHAYDPNKPLVLDVEKFMKS